MTTSAPHPQRCHECFEDPIDLELHWRRSLGHSCDWCDLTHHWCEFYAAKISQDFTNQVAHCPKDAPSRKNVPKFRFKGTSDIGQYGNMLTLRLQRGANGIRSYVYDESFNQVSFLSPECPIVANPHQRPQLRGIVSIHCPCSSSKHHEFVDVNSTNQRASLSIWSNHLVCQVTLHSGKRSLQSSANCRATSTRACSESKAG